MCKTARDSFYFFTKVVLTSDDGLACAVSSAGFYFGRNVLTNLQFNNKVNSSMDEESHGIDGLRIINDTGHLEGVSKSEMPDVYRRLSITDGGDVSPEDWEKLERLKGLAELMDSVFFWCWTEKTANGFTPRHPKAAQNRFVAMTALVRPDLIEGKSYEEIGEQIGVGKAWLSALAKDFQKNFGLKFQRSHKDGGNHAAAAKKVWQKKNAKT